MNRISVCGIKTGYGKKSVLTDVSFTADAGQCIGIVGANGSGKTTLFQILSGLKKPDQGKIVFDGVTADEKTGNELFIRYTGYAPQEGILIPELTVYDNLLLWYVSKEELQKAGQKELWHSLKIEEILHIKVRNLSIGMRKKVGIACALAGNPSILLLDEPDASLDLYSKAELRRYLLMYKQTGGTIILATHDESQLDLCDKVYALSHGKCKEIDKTLRGEVLMGSLKALI